MAKLSPDESVIIKKHPLTESVDELHGVLQEVERFYELRSISYDGPVDDPDQLYLNEISKLLSILLGEDAALNIRSRESDGNVASDLANLFTSLQRGNFSYIHYRWLVRLVIQRPPPAESQNVEIWNFNVWNAVLDLIDTASRASTPPPYPISSIQQTPWSRNTSSFVSSTEYRTYVDIVLKEELGELHVNIPGFFDAYFGDIPQLNAVSQAVLEGRKKADSPLYNEEDGWWDWPELAADKDVLRWLTNIIAELVQFAEAQESSPKINCRPLAQPNQPLQGSVAARKLDIGFVDDPTATEDSRCR